MIHMDTHPHPHPPTPALSVVQDDSGTHEHHQTYERSLQAGGEEGGGREREESERERRERKQSYYLAGVCVHA